MRIVGGKWRGRNLRTPEGRNTRPSTDRTRESAASMIEAAFGLDLTDISMLDAYAGSGAMSFELLSRGAAHATCIDSSKAAISIMRANAKSLKASPGQASIILGDAELMVEKSLRSGRALTGAPFDLVFLDPPYATTNETLEQLIAQLKNSGQLRPGAVILLEREAKTPALNLAQAGIPDAQSRGPKRHGITSLELITLPSEEQPTLPSKEQPTLSSKEQPTLSSKEQLSDVPSSTPDTSDSQDS